MKKLRKIRDRRLSTIDTLVPGQEPVTLMAYYPQMADYYRTCELQTKAWLAEGIGNDWTCIDVGAHIGYMSIVMARSAPLGQVFALEPTSTYEMMVTNIQANDVPNVQPRQLGVSDRSFTGVESIYRVWGEKPESTEVQFVTLDDFVTAEGLYRVDLVKIDTDGFELEVLRGALKVLQEHSPVVIVELNHALATRGHTVAECMQLLLDCKYSDAVVLDKENYRFTRDWELGQPWPASISISFDRRSPAESFEVSPKAGSSRELEFVPQSHNGAHVNRAGAWSLSGPAWSYAVIVELPPEALRLGAVLATVSVQEGDAGIFLSDRQGKAVLGIEKFVTAGQTVDVLLPVPDSTAALMVIRKVTGPDLVVRLGPIAACETTMCSSPTRELSQLSRVELQETLGLSMRDSWATTPLDRVRAVSRSDLAAALGEASLYPTSGIHVAANKLVMERDDAPILEWIYRVLKPSRHFEFGTWEGFGTLLCLRSTDAEVWTVNLPDGEFRDGVATYPRSREPALAAQFLGRERMSTDSEDSVGWMYRAAGKTDRVRQLLCSSERLQGMELPWSTFDTVLIDGSHDRAVVRSDQTTAIQLVKPTGIVIWHDFTLDQSVVEAQPSTRGVVAAVADDISLMSEGRELLWLRDSLILLSVPRDSLPGA